MYSNPSSTHKAGKKPLTGATSMATEQRCNVYSCGWGDHHRLGFDNTDTQLLPQPIESLKGTRVMEVAAGGRHSLFLQSE
jgi:alpha-tubulin suppressor-like RCC1 family protein